MTVILYLLAGSLVMGAGALAVFLWSLRTGQYEDLDGAANRVLFDDDQTWPSGSAARDVAPQRADPSAGHARGSRGYPHG